MSLAKSLRGCPYNRLIAPLGLAHRSGNPITPGTDHVCDLADALRNRGEHELANGLLDWAADGRDDHDGQVSDFLDALELATTLHALQAGGEWSPKGYSVVSLVYPGGGQEVTIHARSQGAFSAEPLLAAATPEAATEWLHKRDIALKPQA